MKTAIVMWLRDFGSATYAAPHRLCIIIGRVVIVLLNKSDVIERRYAPRLLSAALVAIPFNIIVHLMWLVSRPIWAYNEYILKDIDWK